ncbi:MAG: pantoate--beta-alanine ligase [Betaproteobacteria bacterium]|nr:pantoate--beta-alanine ligase [Betaproteobacteria bacterium]MBU6512006.1 pantoate--beta-alanine ligase [Betaproteobacteria bacterium]MDE1955278.1 pantoate--beta-alanine ligase [Betaproteobacteria bacterium]MDE2151461.1 pantoate--beta-alanine ligase [Betaproteobacteria bacterium]MDE2479934.1 pantoate--beta-alanine ligase [Betaproteobacteria bacterium]
MRMLHSRAALREALSPGPRPVLVPTMGNLHAGHLALVARARELGAPVIASVFVNRLQFGPGEDFDRYPRTLQRDAQLLEQAGCDLLFAPDEAEMYPAPQTFHVRPDPRLAGELEGASRPGHFEGVTTVVLKLLQLVQPAAAVFGKKDYQQLMLIRAMVEQFALPVRIEGLDTVREEDGLALSSRNGYLGPDERARAPQLARALRELAARARACADLGQLRQAQAEAEQGLRGLGWEPDYLSVRRRADLQAPQRPEELRLAAHLVVLGAARLGRTRLIDNLEF